MSIKLCESKPHTVIEVCDPYTTLECVEAGAYCFGYVQTPTQVMNATHAIIIWYESYPNEQIRITGWYLNPTVLKTDAQLLVGTSAWYNVFVKADDCVQLPDDEAILFSNQQSLESIVATLFKDDN